jgi:hypothetical protein
MASMTHQSKGNESRVPAGRAALSGVMFGGCGLMWCGRRGFVMVLTAAVVLVSLPACVGQRVSYGPGVSFECRLSVWPAFEPPVEYLVQKDSLGRATITEFRYRGAGGSGAKRSGVPVVHGIDAKR